MKKLLIAGAMILALGLFFAACNTDDGPDGPGPIDPIDPIDPTGSVTAIDIKVTNASGQNAGVVPVQLPPGARVVVSAEVTKTGTISGDYTVTVTDGGTDVTATDEDDEGAKRLNISATAVPNMTERKWITVTVKSTANTELTDEWKFVVWGAAVEPSNSYAFTPQLEILPPLTVAPRAGYEDSYRTPSFTAYEDDDEDVARATVTVESEPMMDRYRLVGYPVAVYREDGEAGEEDKLASEYNGAGYITGEDLEMLFSLKPGSLVRLYFNRENLGFVDNVFGYANQGRNGWGVLKFGDDDGGYNAPNNSQTFFIDASIDAAKDAMAANHEDELFVNVFNSRLLFMEAWELVRPMAWTSKGVILEQADGAGAGLTMSGTGTYADQYALIAEAGEGSYWQITIESPEIRSGWGVAQIGGSSNYYTVNIVSPETLENGWVRFTATMDLFTMYRNSSFTIADTAPYITDNIVFNVWNMNQPGGAPGSGTPRFVKVELFAIDD